MKAEDLDEAELNSEMEFDWYKQMLFYDREMELYEKSNITFKIFFLIQFELQMEIRYLALFSLKQFSTSGLP
jgi:hypothetical protein